MCSFQSSVLCLVHDFWFTFVIFYSVSHATTRPGHGFLPCRSCR
jgi:hypothetical protein